ncbi:30S ribosomal protein S20 [Candidatus Xianfuyuplasma coldseepsis]|uniref:Small ribosomal subunit protein bS20 n=1 Tax=Candidatus Xianfuyuplasma coldseepsis TaxID=2782163 RepID=A0A7L7KS36_9MOLU|nr:30S ribosomal protein S20 [Xianfuyuplasma coldseepsis]QMS85631.1 30S ribosomal protein S20 [Xianfuyuplasma coldseepsis]
MANIKGQMKRNLTNEKRRLANASFKSGLKTAIKNVETSAAANDKSAATSNLSIAFQKLDKSVTKGIHHKNYVARQKSRLSKLVDSL